MAKHRLALLLSVVGFLLAIVGGSIAVSSYVAVENERRLHVVADQVRNDLNRAHALLASHAENLERDPPQRSVVLEEDEPVRVGIYRDEEGWTVVCVGSSVPVDDPTTWEHALSEEALENLMHARAKHGEAHTIWFESEPPGRVRLHVAFADAALPLTIRHASTPVRAPADAVLLARCDVVDGAVVSEALTRYAVSDSISGSNSAWPTLEFLGPDELIKASRGLTYRELAWQQPGAGFMKFSDASPRLVLRIPPVGPPPGVVTLWTLAISMSLIALALFVVRRRTEAESEADTDTEAR